MWTPGLTVDLLGENIQEGPQRLGPFSSPRHHQGQPGVRATVMRALHRSILHCPGVAHLWCIHRPPLSSPVFMTNIRLISTVFDVAFPCSLKIHLNQVLPGPLAARAFELKTCMPCSKGYSQYLGRRALNQKPTLTIINVCIQAYTDSVTRLTKSKCMFEWDPPSPGDG